MSIPDDPEIGFYETPDGIQRGVLKGGRVVCDFCLAPNPPWTYPCGVVRLLGHRAFTHSDDPWGACDACHDLIEAKDIGGLVERMCTYQKIHHPPDHQTYYPPLPIMRLTQRRNVIAFLSARTGPAERDVYPPE